VLNNNDSTKLHPPVIKYADLLHFSSSHIQNFVAFVSFVFSDMFGKYFG